MPPSHPGGLCSYNASVTAMRLNTTARRERRGGRRGSKEVKDRGGGDLEWTLRMMI